MQNFIGKVAVVTGGAGGIGLAIARELAAKGCKLVLADLDVSALERARASLADLTADVYCIRCDVSNFEEVESLAKQTVAHFGKVHIVANNAGVSITGPIWKLSLDDWRWVYDVNVWGVVHGIKAFVPLMIEQGEGGHVINTASLAAFSGIGEHAVYCSSKAAVLSMSQALFSEMAGHKTGIGVTCLCPGMVATEIHKSWRHRPKGDAPWSDREWNDESHRKGSDAFQEQGISAEDCARLTIAAIEADELYAYTGNWQQTMARGPAPAMARTNPMVITWGADLRSDSERADELRVLAETAAQKS